MGSKENCESFGDEMEIPIKIPFLQENFPENFREISSKKTKKN